MTITTSMGIGEWLFGGLKRYGDRAMRNPAKIDEMVGMAESVANRMPRRRVSFMVLVYLRQAETRLAAGQFDDALTSIDQAIARGGQRVDRKWLNVEQNVSVALRTRSTILEKLERPEDALASAEAALEHVRQLVELDPARFQPIYAGTLTTLAEILGHQGRTEEAAEKAEHALTVLRGLAGNQDGRLASALRVLATELGKAERFHDALPAIAEEIEIFQRLRVTQEPYLADRLRVYAAFLRLAGRPEEALRAVDESITRWERLVAREPGQHDEGRAIARRVRAECFEDLAG